MTDIDINELKQLVLQTLEAKDALGKIKAQLRASVYTAIEEQERASGVYLENPTTRKLLDSGEGKIVVDLLREFFEFCGLESTCSVFLPEANLPQSYSGRNGLSKQLNLTVPNDKPLLFEVINQYNQKKGIATPTTSSTASSSSSSTSSSTPVTSSLAGAPSLGLGPREREKQEAARKLREEEDRVKKEKEENEKREKERKEKERIDAENAKKKQQEALAATTSKASLSSLSDLPTPPLKRSVAPLIDDREPEKPKTPATKAAPAPTKSAASPEPVKKAAEPLASPKPSSANLSALPKGLAPPTKGGLVFLDDDEDDDLNLLGKKKPAAAPKKSSISLSDDEEEYDEDFDMSDDDLSDVTDDRSGEGISISGYDLVQNADRP